MGSFIGEIEQVPPAYSAIKRDGVPAYKLARKGKSIDLPARRIRIDSFELLEWESPRIDFRIVCQSGTYVRSVAHDLGAALKTGGYLESLSRTASGSWKIDDSLSLEELEEAADADGLKQLIRPLSEVLPDMPKVSVSEEQAGLLANGQSLELEVDGQPETIGAWTSTGRLVAVMVPGGPGRWSPKKVFPAEV